MISTIWTSTLDFREGGRCHSRHKKDFALRLKYCIRKLLISVDLHLLVLIMNNCPLATAQPWALARCWLVTHLLQRSFNTEYFIDIRYLAVSPRSNNRKRYNHFTTLFVSFSGVFLRFTRYRWKLACIIANCISISISSIALVFSSL